MRSRFAILGTCLALVGCCSIGVAVCGKKMKPEEVVEKHLASLSPMQKTVDSLKAEGLSSLTDARGGNEVRGRVTLTSQGPKVRLSMFFGLNGYPGEELAYDGKEVSVGWIAPGTRSDLENFFKQFKEVLAEGLLGGSLSTGWPLTRLQERKAEVKYDGLKKVDDKEYHVLRYRGRKGGSAQTSLYFDPETFRHRHSIHKVRIGVPMVHNPNVSAALDETWYILKESFDDFQEAGGGAIPTTWTIEFTTQTGRAGTVMRWTNRFSTIEKPAAVDPNLFVVVE
ncbi:MAG: hypothetical protein ACE15E_04190 [Acidobacteriota bacterium]